MEVVSNECSAENDTSKEDDADRKLGDESQNKITNDDTEFDDHDSENSIEVSTVKRLGIE